MEQNTYWLLPRLSYLQDVLNPKKISDSIKSWHGWLINKAVTDYLEVWVPGVIAKRHRCYCGPAPACLTLDAAGAVPVLFFWGGAATGRARVRTCCIRRFPARWCCVRSGPWWRRRVYVFNWMLRKNTAEPAQQTLKQYIHASNPIRLATPHTTATHHKQRKAQLLSCPTLTFLIQLTSANVMHLYASSQKVIDFFMYIWEPQNSNLEVMQ